MVPQLRSHAPRSLNANWHVGQHTRSSRIRQEGFCKISDPKRARSLVIPYWESEFYADEGQERFAGSPPGSSRDLIRAAHRLPGLKAMAAKARRWRNAEGVGREHRSQLHLPQKARWAKLPAARSLWNGVDQIAQGTDDGKPH